MEYVGTNLISWKNINGLEGAMSFPYEDCEPPIMKTSRKRITQFGKAIASRRKLLNITQEALANSSGFLLERIEAIENGDIFVGEIDEAAILALAKSLLANPQLLRILATVDDRDLTV